MGGRLGKRLGRPVPESWLATASGLAQELGASAGDRLVHADLQYGNVLVGNREPWLAIDPKPVAGDTIKLTSEFGGGGQTIEWTLKKS